MDEHEVALQLLDDFDSGLPFDVEAYDALPEAVRNIIGRIENGDIIPVRGARVKLRDHRRLVLPELDENISGKRGRHHSERHLDQHEDNKRKR